MKIRVVKTRILRKRLLDLGFEEETRRDHIFYFYRHGGKIVVRTKVSHGANEMRQPVLELIGKQLHLERHEFDSFLKGELSKAVATLPLFLLLALGTALGVGLWLSALSRTHNKP